MLIKKEKMDTSKEFIKMCEMAIEIQYRWRPKNGDLCLSGNSVRMFRTPNVLYYLDQPNYSLIETDFLLKRDINRIVCLPTQSQLQGMVKGDKDLWYFMDQFFGFITKPRIFEGEKAGENYCDILNSMEQLWLAFVMKEKYNKSWNEEKQDWIK